ncbi:MAG: hypothetical protein AB2A00_10000 [Myxococcota bacterium]
MELSKISYLDLYYLAHFVGEALKTQGAAIHDTMTATEGADWKTKYDTATAAYRGAFSRLIKEESEASLAVAEQNAIRGKFTHSRRHLENVAKREKRPEVRKVLLRAAGYGAGTPRTPKEYRDFVVTYRDGLSANRQRFLDLGAKPAALDLAAGMAEALDAAGTKAMHELNDVGVARADLKQRYADAVEAIRLVDVTAQGELEGAHVLEDKEAIDRCSELLGLFDQAVAQARVEARKREQEGPLPEDVLLPPVNDANAEPVDGGTTMPVDGELVPG